MRRVLIDLWSIITTSTRELEEPAHRILAMCMFIFLCFLVVLGLSALVFGFVENIIELICNTINTTVIGEFPEVIE